MRRAAASPPAPTAAPWAPAAPAPGEYELEAELHHEFRHHGARPRPTAHRRRRSQRLRLHYVETTSRCSDGDAGADRRRLRARRLRVRHHPHLPGQWPLQRPRRRRCTRSSSPRRTPPSPRPPRPSTSGTAHDAATRVLPRATSTSACSRAASTTCSNPAATASFYMHRTGHWLGPGRARCRRIQGRRANGACRSRARPSPSSPASTSARPTASATRWPDIGIRIEDDVRVTPDGCDIYTSAPKTIAEIEEVMRRD